MLLCMPAQTQPILFAHTQSDIETDACEEEERRRRRGLSVCPQLSISRLARMSLKRTIVAMAAATTTTAKRRRESVRHCNPQHQKCGIPKFQGSWRPSCLILVPGFDPTYVLATSLVFSAAVGSSRNLFGGLCGEIVSIHQISKI